MALAMWLSRSKNRDIILKYIILIITKGYHTKMRHRSFLILSIFLIYGQGCLKVIHIPPVELGDRNAYTCSCLCGPGLNDDNLLHTSTMLTSASSVQAVQGFSQIQNADFTQK